MAIKGSLRVYRKVAKLLFIKNDFFIMTMTAGILLLPQLSDHDYQEQAILQSEYGYALSVPCQLLVPLVSATFPRE